MLDVHEARGSSPLPPTSFFSHLPVGIPYAQRFVLSPRYHKRREECIIIS